MKHYQALLTTRESFTAMADKYSLSAMMMAGSWHPPAQFAAMRFPKFTALMKKAAS